MGPTEIWIVVMVSLLIGLPLRYLRHTRQEQKALRREVEELRRRVEGRANDAP